MAASKLSIIVAIAKNRVIGNQNQLPWHLPADLKHFKALTIGKPIIMGRKTFVSIGKPLPQRRNIIISRQSDFVAANCEVAHSLSQAIELASTEPEIMIIGGSQIFQAALPMTTTIYLTVIDQDFIGDVFFPELELSEWRESSRENYEPDTKNLYAYSFITLERKQQ